VLELADKFHLGWNDFIMQVQVLSPIFNK